MTITIHQPNFVPWYPFFEKMEQADLFVILAHCQFEKNNYQNRFYADGWNTMSVNKGLEPITKKRYVNPFSDWGKILKRHPQLDVFTPFISPNLATTNIRIIRKAAEILKIKTPIIMDYPTSLKGTERLVDICLEYRANKYLSGPSGEKYLDLPLFEKIGVEVVFQKDQTKKPLVECL